MMKNDISNPDFIKKRTQNIKYILLKELGYETNDLKIEIMPYGFKGSPIQEISFQFYLVTMCEGDLSDIYEISTKFTKKIEKFFIKLGFNEEYQFVGNPNIKDFNLMGPMISYVEYSAADDVLKINVEYIYETIESINPQTSE